jgi:hypothetical protein
MFSCAVDAAFAFVVNGTGNAFDCFIGTAVNWHQRWHQHRAAVLLFITVLPLFSLSLTCYDSSC